MGLYNQNWRLFYGHFDIYQNACGASPLHECDNGPSEARKTIRYDHPSQKVREKWRNFFKIFRQLLDATRTTNLSLSGFGFDDDTPMSVTLANLENSELGF